MFVRWDMIIGVASLFTKRSGVSHNVRKHCAVAYLSHFSLRVFSAMWCIPAIFQLATTTTITTITTTTIATTATTITTITTTTTTITTTSKYHYYYYYYHHYYYYHYYMHVVNMIKSSGPPPYKYTVTSYDLLCCLRACSLQRNLLFSKL